jgi:hypothetical protein
VTKTDRVVKVPHLVLARFLTRGGSNINTGEDKIAVNKGSCAIILLFTVAANYYSCCFNPSTYFKLSKQYNSVKIFN